MGWFSRKPAGDKATVKKFKVAQNKGQKNFGFLVLKDGREVYFNQDHLDQAKITKIDVGQEVHVVHEPSTKRPGSLQAKSISV